MRVLDLLFPPACPACGRLTGGGYELCDDCLPLWQKEKRSRCARCGQMQFACRCPIPLPEGGDDSVLPRSGLEQVHLSAYRPGRGGVTERLTLRAKEKALACHRTLIGRELGAALAGELDGDDPPILTYLPRRPDKVRVSGTDQAKQIARALGDALGLTPISLLARRGGEDQKTMNAAERFAAAASRYRLKRGAAERIRGKTVWLCDDVITTGASALACARLLLGAGAKRVLAVAPARCDRTREEDLDEEKNRD